MLLLRAGGQVLRRYTAAGPGPRSSRSVRAQSIHVQFHSPSHCQYINTGWTTSHESDSGL